MAQQLYHATFRDGSRIDIKASGHQDAITQANAFAKRTGTKVKSVLSKGVVGQGGNGR